MLAKLIVASGKSAGRTIALKNGRLLIGRQEDCDIRPLGEDVSRRHCEILLEGESLTVYDFKSRNGTYVNGTKIESETRVSVKQGDIIRVGPLEVTVATDKPSTPVAVDDVSRWLMADDDPAGMFDTTQTVRRAEDPTTPVAIPASLAGPAETPAVAADETAKVPAAAAEGTTPVAAAAADDSASRTASMTAIEALRASRGRPGSLPADAKKAKSDSSRDAAADALRKFFGKR